MFKQAGTFEGPILDIVIAEPRFSDDPNAFDICLKVKGPDLESRPQEDWWRGEMSNKYGKGNFAGKTQREITMTDLSKIGFQGDDLTTLEEQLKGKVIQFTVEAREYNNKTYYDVKYIGGGDFVPKAIDKAALKARLEALTNPEAALKARMEANKEKAAANPPSEEDWL